MRESAHIADLQRDHRGKDFANTGSRPQELDSGGRSNFGAYAVFDGLDVRCQLVQGSELDLDHAGRFGWKVQQTGDS